MPKCDFNKVEKHALVWVFSCRLPEYLFIRTPLEGCFRANLKDLKIYSDHVMFPITFEDVKIFLKNQQLLVY